MKKKYELWTVEQLVKRIDEIEFPEFQREPTVWGLQKKQSLIDSILRDFDISLIYFYKSNKGFDCIDGRQRINAILSYLGINESDKDNEFHLKITNEIYDDGKQFTDADEKRYKFLDEPWQKKIKTFRLNIVTITDVDNEEDLNLLFLRLQLGAVLNAGERLHAMTGDMRDFIFRDLIRHKFFTAITIPRRRFAREQVAAQIVLNYYSKIHEDTFHRSRYIDLQEFFKEKVSFTADEKSLVKGLNNVLDKLVKVFGTALAKIHNRAIAVSVVLFANDLITSGNEKKVATFKNFFLEFLRALKWQVPKGVQMDQNYWGLLKFQTGVTQAAGEKYSIEQRHNSWREYYYIYEKEGIIKGDKEYKKKSGKDPMKQRAGITF